VKGGKKVSSKRAKPAAFDAHHSLPPPPMPVVDIGALGGGARAGAHNAFEEKQRLGADIQQLDESNYQGLFAIIQRHKGNNNAMTTEADEVELDLNTMTPDCLAEVRIFVDSILRK
jgi:hypothetical protein